MKKLGLFVILFFNIFTIKCMELSEDQVVQAYDNQHDLNCLCESCLADSWYSIKKVQRQLEYYSYRLKNKKNLSFSSTQNELVNSIGFLVRHIKKIPIKEVGKKRHDAKGHHDQNEYRISRAFSTLFLSSVATSKIWNTLPHK